MLQDWYESTLSNAVHRMRRSTERSSGVQDGMGTCLDRELSVHLSAFSFRGTKGSSFIAHEGCHSRSACVGVMEDRPMWAGITKHCFQGSCALYQHCENLPTRSLANWRNGSGTPRCR